MIKPTLTELIIVSVMMLFSFAAAKTTLCKEGIQRTTVLTSATFRVRVKFESISCQEFILTLGLVHCCNGNETTVQRFFFFFGAHFKPRT